MKTNPHSLKLIQADIRTNPNALTLEPWAILDMIEDLLEFHAKSARAVTDFNWHLPFSFVDTHEEIYQAFKSRLKEECSVVERMTPEEYEEWKQQMVAKK